MLRFRVLGTAGNEVQAEVDANATFSDIARQVCEQAGVDSSQQYVRIICNGRERMANDPVQAYAGQVMHYTLVPLNGVSGGPNNPMNPNVTSSPTEPVDLLERLDPFMLLTSILTGVLALLWGLLIWKPSSYSPVSIVILIGMTAAFIMAWWGTSAASSSSSTAQQQGGSNTTAGASPPPPRRHMYDAPPRPPPIVRRGQGLGGAGSSTG